MGFVTELGMSIAARREPNLDIFERSTGWAPWSVGE